MQIIEKKLNELFEYENNPRINDNAVEAVAKSIDTLGFRVPIIIDNNGVIITGHTRKKAAEKLGLEKVPVIIADDLTPEQVKLFRLIDNKTSELSGWDFFKLETELSELSDIDIDLDDFGFDWGIKVNDAIDLDDEVHNEKTNNKQMCHCPKCGFIFEVKK